MRSHFSGKGPLLDFLHDRWIDHRDGGRYKRTIWDLSLVQAVLFPEWATQSEVDTPPENRSRKVWVYKKIQAEKMKQEFFEHLKAHQRAASSNDRAEVDSDG